MAAFEFFQQLAGLHPEIKVTWKSALVRAILSGGLSYAGALLGGPIGGLFGAGVAAAIVYATALDYKSVPEILQQMSSAERQLLERDVREVCHKKGIDYAATVAGNIAEAAANVIIKQVVEARRLAVKT